ncbi:MAG: deoxyribose-phosphate aldolase [Ferruginibacter sp.]
MGLTEHIDHTCLKPDATLRDVELLCSEAIEYKFSNICVPPLFVKKAKSVTAETNIRTATVIGFPFGYSAIEAKIAEIVLAVIDEADELEVVVNTAAVKNADWQFLANEINNMMPVIRSKGKKITVILETGLMTDTEIITACDIYGAAGVDFVKAGTGTMENSRIVEQVKLIRKHLAETIPVKAATGVKNYREARDLLNAGANRISCSNSLIIVQEQVQ